MPGLIDAMSGAFSDLRVLELGSSVAASYCGKIFADFNSEVIKIEPPGGDPLRHGLVPLISDTTGETHSGVFAWLNTNKRSVTADLESVDGAAGVHGLASGADVVIDGRSPATREASPLKPDALRNSKGDLVVVTLSSFGEDGPYRDFLATESVCRALSGVVSGIGPIDGPPLIANDGQAGVLTGLAAFIAAAGGLHGRAQGARQFSVSMQEALVHIIGMDTATALVNGRRRQRYGINRFGQTHPASIYETREGWIGTTTQTPQQWRTVCEILGCPDLASDPRFATGAGRAKAADELDAIFVELFKVKTAEEWFDIGRKKKLAFAIVPSMEALLRQQVHRDRGAFVDIRIGDVEFEGPVLPHRLMLTPPAAGGVAPLAGEHNRNYPQVAAKSETPRKSASTAERPLDGVKIVDVTMGWAGPLATRFLADLGAEVIKIEACEYPDWWRGFERSDRWLREKLYEKSPPFNSMNSEKKGITLDLTRREGVKLFEDLVAGADAVIENYSADVLPRLGIGYDRLRQINPSLVMVAMPAFGSSGTWSDCRGYGTTLEQASGLPSISGAEGGPPTMSQYAYADPYGGFNAAAAMLLALLHKQRTGEGQFVEMAHVGGMLALAAPGIIEQSATGKIGPRMGNRHPFHVPHGAFRCVGDDEWIVVAVTDDAQWRSLCNVMGRPDLADLIDRRANEATIEAAINQWTVQQTSEAAMTRLQAEGVPAGRVLSSLDVVHDANLVARGFWQCIPRGFVGESTVASAPFRLGGAPFASRRPAPTVGQHNKEVLGAGLGLSGDDLDLLEIKGVIGTEVRLKAKVVVHSDLEAGLLHQRDFTARFELRAIVDA